MRYLSEDEATRMMGLGYVGELYEDLDGHLYGWVEGLDEWGEPVGFWEGLSDAEVPASSGMGALYESPDGTVYQVQGLEEEEEGAEAAPEGEAAAAAEPAEAEPSAESEAPPATGPGRPGRPRGFRRLRPVARGRRRPHLRARGARPGRPGPGAKGGPPRKRRGGFFKKLLPIAKFASRFIPIPGAGAVVRGGLTLASKLGKRKGVAGLGGIGALYAAPDGTVYQVQGLAAEDLDGLYADEELRGFAADEELRGFPRTKNFEGSTKTKNCADSPRMKSCEDLPRTKSYVASRRMKSCADFLRTKIFEGSTKAMSGRTLSAAWTPIYPPSRQNALVRRAG